MERSDCDVVADPDVPVSWEGEDSGVAPVEKGPSSSAS